MAEIIEFTMWVRDHKVTELLTIIMNSWGS